MGCPVFNGMTCVISIYLIIIPICLKTSLKEMCRHVYAEKWEESGNLKSSEHSKKLKFFNKIFFAN